jgi:hypothetical protein
MRFDEPNDDVHSLPAEALSFLQHFVRLANARRKAEINLQTPAALPPNQAQEMLRRGRRFCGIHASIP